MRTILLLLVSTSCVRAQDHVDVEALVETRPKAFAAPTGFNSIDVAGESKNFMKIPGGYRDGFQKVIFDEIGQNVPRVPDVPDGFDRFGAYDDGNVITDINKEPKLFVPLPYRSEAEKAAAREEAKRIRAQSRPTPPPPTPTPTQPAIIIPNRANRPLVSDNFQQNQQVTLRPRVPPPPGLAPPQLPPFQPQRPQFVGQPRTPPRGFTLPSPRAPFTPPPPAFNNNFQQTRTQQPFPQQPFPQQTFPQQNFPQQPFQQHTFQQQTFPQQTFQQQTFPQQPTRPPPTVPQPTSPRPTPNSPQPNTNRPLRPFRPTSPQPNRQGDNLRTGTCHHTIYYKTRDASQNEVRETLTHFAMVVSVDQCARTCHEFNCAHAVFDPSNLHCQFNPGTVFGQQGFCEQWPNPLYRNNIPLGPRAVVIECVTCQRRRRVGNPLQRSIVQRQPRIRPASRAAVRAQRLHGVVLNENTPAETQDALLRRAIANAEFEELVALNKDSQHVVRSTVVDAEEKLPQFEAEGAVPNAPVVQVPRKTLGVKILKLDENRDRISAETTDLN